MSPPLLAVEDLVVRFPDRRRGWRGAPAGWVRAVDGASFALERGESLGLVGESGCGKTTTARAVAGLVRADSGSIRLDGLELTALPRRAWKPVRRRLQIVFQDPWSSLDPRQSVAEILTEPLAVHRVGKPRERRLRALELLDQVGLNPRHLYRYPHEFSGGQRQRVGIARALALEPELILCDEPVSSLDVSVQAQILNLLADLKRRTGVAYLFISHDLAVVSHLCERVAVMYLGRVVESGPRDELLARPRHPYTQALLAAVPDPARRGRPPAPLAGEPPSPAAPPPGCAFHPRCPEVARVPGERCRRERPELLPVPLQPAWRSACHLHDER